MTNTISSTPAKQHVKQPMVFNAEELNSRVEKARHAYKNSHLSCHRLQAPIMQMFAVELIELSKKGYEVNTKLPASAGAGSYVVYLNKPEALQAEDLQVIVDEIEAKYRAEIAEFNTRQQELLTEQMYQAQVAKEKKAQEDKDNQMREKAAAEAAKYYQGLIAKESN